MTKRQQPKGRWIRVERRYAIYFRDGFKCGFCRKTLHEDKPHDIVLDHLHPLSKEGGNDSANLLTSCRPCNGRKKDILFEEYVGIADYQRITKQVQKDMTEFLKLGKLYTLKKFSLEECLRLVDLL